MSIKVKIMMTDDQPLPQSTKLDPLRTQSECPVAGLATRPRVLSLGLACGEEGGGSVVVEAAVESGGVGWLLMELCSVVAGAALVAVGVVDVVGGT